jgi:alkylation response protein AidB-like acyl-CoA dehydrogenase
VDLLLDDDAQAFRAEVRSWLADHVPAQPLPSMDTAEGFEAHRAWEAEMAADAMSVVSWPAEYGGRDVPLLHWVIFEEELYRDPHRRRLAAQRAEDVEFALQLRRLGIRAVPLG